MASNTVVILPVSILSKADLARAIRELEDYDRQAQQAALRGATLAVTHFSQGIIEIARTEELQLDATSDRQQLLSQLQHLQGQTQQVNVSFAVQPSRRVVETITTWLRRNVSPSIIVQVGIQPSLIGGCVIRTTNRVFDFGFSQHLAGGSALLRQEMAQL